MRDTAQWLKLYRFPTLVLAALGTLALAAGEGGGRGLVIRSSLAPGDTTVVWGPFQFNGSSGQGQTYVEAFTASVAPERQYVLHLVNGNASGTQRASKVKITLNGFEVVAQTEVSQSVALLDRVVALTETDTIRVTVAGSGNPFITLSLLSPPAPEYVAFGPKQYAIPSGTTKTTNEIVDISTAGTTGRLYVTNGAPDGTRRVTSAAITLNGTTVVSTSELKSTVGSLTKAVSLRSINNLSVTVNGSVNSFVTVRITAPDESPPIVTITSPSAGAFVGATSVGIAGTLSDRTPVTVTVNGAAATVSNNTSYTATVPLPAEGSNLLTVQATDGASHVTTVTRTVIRDTQTPVLSVTAPADGSGTRDTSITVSGTVSDANPVSVSVNGTPLTVTGGNFSGPVALAYGPNVLTTTATDGAGNAATDVRTVTRDTVAPVLTVSAPVGGTSVSSESVVVSGTVTDQFPVTVTANGINLPVTSGSFSGSVPLGPGANVVLVVATDQGSNRSVVSRAVFRAGSIPPDPSTVASAIDPSSATTFESAIAFLYSGANPIQTGVAPGTIKPLRAAVFKGRALDRAGQPLSGAAVTVAGHPEFGGTYTRADGAFDLAVNGGDQLVIQLAKAGYLSVQRSVLPLTQDFLVLEDVVLSPADTAATQIAFADPVETAHGSTVSDTSGARRATLMFKQGTQASMTLADGSVQPLASVSVRATELTVGPNGPAAMPGTLPATSGYTYAVDLTLDEAVAAGATDVQFSKPVAFYLDNFLGVPVGAKMPVGFYDEQKGRWVPSPDGKVLKIVAVSGGRADLDLTGDGIAEDSAALAAIGIDGVERERLATEYAAGKTLWRVQVTHFTKFDINMAIWFAVAWVAPSLRAVADFLDNLTKPNCSAMSVIECETRTLGEQLPVAGTAYFLAYRSDRQAGRVGKGTVRIPLTEATVPAGVKRVELEVEVAGKKFDTSFAVTPNLTHVYSWDGRDAYGRIVQAAQRATIRVGYTYDAVYQSPSQLLTETFGQYSVNGVTAVPARQEITAWQEQEVMLGGFDAAAAVRLGGWTLSAHHFYDPNARMLYLGTGERRDAEGIGPTISTFAGTGVAGFDGDGGPATAAKLNWPLGVAVGPDGSVYIGEYNNMRIRKVDPQGIITTVAGNGSRVISGDGGPATQAGIWRVLRLDVAPDGTITFGTDSVARVRQIAPNGIISTIAGTGTPGFSGDGGPATQAQLSIFPREAQHGADGSVYFIDGANHRVRRVSPSGKVSTIAGTGSAGFVATDTVAGTARINFPEALAVGPDGSVYIEDGDNIRNRRITPDGKIKVVWGTGQSGTSGDGGRGTAAQLGFQAQGIDAGPDGALYLAEFDFCKVRRLGTDGIVTTVAGTGSCGFGGDGGPARQARLNGPFDVAVGPDGAIYVPELSNNRVRRIAPAFPGFSASDIAVASEDGTELYQFNASGKHLRTRDARTGAVLLTFGYDAAGALSTVTDGDGNVTTIERDAQGRPTAIIGPFGQRTTLAVDGAGYLASVTDPGGNLIRLYHSPAGLLDSLEDARGNLHRFAYDQFGRLQSDADPAGGSKTLTSVESDTSISVTVATALNRNTTYKVFRLPTGGLRREVTDPAGLTTLRIDTNATRTTTTPDGTRVDVTDGADPRWGMLAPVPATVSTRLPSGLTATVTGGRRATLANVADPLSLTALTDSALVNGQLFRSVYDGATRRWTSTSPEGRQAFTTLDSLGRVRGLRTPGLDSVTYRYDARGRLDRVQTGGRVTSYTYDPSGRLATATDPVGRTDSLFYDTADRLTRHVLPGGRAVLFAYDSSGNLTSLTPPGRPAHGFSSTSIDQDSVYSPPSLGAGTWATEYRYNADRQLTQVIRPDGGTIGFGYEPTSGRPSTVTFDRGTIGLTYGSTTGQLTGFTGPGGVSLAFTYDGLLPKTVTWAGPVTGSVGVSYNSDFRITSQTVNGANAVSFGYDRDGLLTSAGALGLKGHAQHGLLERDSVGSVLGVWSYDPKGALQGYTATVAGAPLFQTSYLRDSLSRITQLTETVQGVTTVAAFSYDSAGRLATVRRDGTLMASYRYDANGNRLDVTTPNGVVTASYDDQDRLTAYGTASYTYTANGELRTRVEGADTTTYAYDALGNLTQVALPDGTSIEYLVDPQNRRIGKQVNGALVRRFLWQSQLAPVAELDGTGALVSRFVYATRANVPDYLVKGGQTYRLVLDHLGSVRLVVNVADGTVAQRLDYDEFGRVTQNTNPGFQPFGFAGGLVDDQTGLVRFGARDYDPGTGRWTAKDPLGFGGGRANLYVYVDCDPVNSIDPTGLQGPPWHHHIIPRGVFNNIPDLSPEAAQWFEDHGTMQTHSPVHRGYSGPHRAYNQAAGEFVAREIAEGRFTPATATAEDARLLANRFMRSTDLRSAGFLAKLGLAGRAFGYAGYLLSLADAIEAQQRAACNGTNVWDELGELMQPGYKELMYGPAPPII
ncbi:MAG TPA: RHS repeat-associated core domain-containing protein [Gemmatimonadales bacterium]